MQMMGSGRRWNGGFQICKWIENILIRNEQWATDARLRFISTWEEGGGFVRHPPDIQIFHRQWAEVSPEIHNRRMNVGQISQKRPMPPPPLQR